MPFDSVSPLGRGRGGKRGVASPFESSLGSRRAGRLGGEGDGPLAETFEDRLLMLALPLVSAAASRLAGNGGRSVVSHAGAFIRFPPLESREVVDVPRPTLVVVDNDASEVVDSREGRRRGSVGLRDGNSGRAAGRAGGGGGWPDLRVGSGGGAFLGFTGGDDCVDGGRGTGLCDCLGAGSFPIDAPSKTEPVTLYEGGLLADLHRSGTGRKSGGSGPCCACLRAAIRSWMEPSCGSSVMAPDLDVRLVKERSSRSDCHRSRSHLV